ncbi:MAG: helix-turn-helix domain-containing protein [Treponema sp.]|nr:helix-turn-helix domain-containing protein [Treponema sp.]
MAAKLNLLVSTPETSTGIWEESHLVRRILGTCEEICGQEGETRLVFLGDLRLIFLFSAEPGEDGSSQERRANRCMGILQDVLLKYYNIYIDWRGGKRVTELSRLPEAYRQLATQPVAHTVQDLFRITIDQELQLITAVSGGDKDKTGRILEDIFSLRDRRKPLEGEFSILMGDLLSLTMKLYQERRIPFPEAEQGIAALDMNRAREYFARLLTDLINTESGYREFSWAVAAAIEYVERHYREDISIPDIGRHCGMNSSYLGTIFKKETGTGLAQFINRVRIQAAGMLMLIKKIPPTQVYEQVGFRNYNNFFNLFKETTGFTPRQFREQVSAGWVSQFHPLRKLSRAVSP